MSMNGEDAWGTRESRDQDGDFGGIAMRDIGEEGYVDRGRNSSVWSYDGDVSTPTVNPLFIPPVEKEGAERLDLAGEAELTDFAEYELDQGEAIKATKKTLAFQGKDEEDNVPIGRFTLRETLQKEAHIVEYLGNKARGLNGCGDVEEAADKQKSRSWSMGTKREVPKPDEEEEENFRRMHGVKFLEEFGVGCSLYLKSIDAFLFLSIFTFVMSLPAIGIFASGSDNTEKGIIVVTDVVPHRLSLGHFPEEVPGIDREWLLFALALIDALSWLIWFIVVGIILRRQQSEKVIADIILTTASDYTVLVRKIPPESNSHSVKEYFEMKMPWELYADWEYHEARILDPNFDRTLVFLSPKWTAGLSGRVVETYGPNKSMFKYLEKRTIKKNENNGTSYDVTFYKLTPDENGRERGWIHDFNEQGNRQVRTIKDHSIVVVADVVVHMACAQMIDALEKRGDAFRKYDRNDGLLQYTKQKIKDIKKEHPELFSEQKPIYRRMSGSSEDCLESIKKHIGLCCARENEDQMKKRKAVMKKRKAAAELERHLNDHQSYELNDEEMRRNVQESDRKVRDFERQILAEGDNFDGMCKRSLEAGAGNIDDLPEHAPVRRFLPHLGGGEKVNHDGKKATECASSGQELRMPANCAFVTFNNAMDCSHVLNDVKKKKEKGILYGEYAPEYAPEPDDIIFENLQVGKSQRSELFRRNYLIIFGLLILTGSVTTLVRLSYYKQESRRDQKDYDYEYCANIGIKAWRDDRCGDVSRGYIHERLSVAGVILACNAFVSFVNLLLKFVIRLRVKTEKHETVSKAAVSEMRAVFLAQYINTSVLVGMFGGPNILEKEFGSLLGKEWYLDNGTSVFTVCLINSIADEIEVRLRMLKKEWDKRYHSARTQQELTEAYRYMKFNLAYQYASFLSMVFSCSTFSAGVPMTNFAFIIFLFIRWYNMKKHLFRYYRKPRTYNEALSDEFMFWVPFAAPIHLIVGIAQYASHEELSTLHEVLFSKQTLPMFVVLVITIMNLMWLHAPRLIPIRLLQVSWVRYLFESISNYAIRCPSKVICLKKKVNLFKDEIIEELPPWDKAVQDWDDRIANKGESCLYKYRMDNIPDYIDRFKCDARARRHSEDRGTLYGQRASAALHASYDIA